VELQSRDDGRDRDGRRGPELPGPSHYLPVQMVPASFSIGTPTAFPYSVQEPS
jgi:hypothetical protein